MTTMVEKQRTSSTGADSSTRKSKQVSTSFGKIACTDKGTSPVNALRRKAEN